MDSCEEQSDSAFEGIEAMCKGMRTKLIAEACSRLGCGSWLSDDHEGYWRCYRCSSR